MKQRRYFAFGLILFFIGFCVFTLNQSLTPYVNFAEAKAANGMVQVRGSLANAKVETINNGTAIRFWLKDESGQVASVIYRGAKSEGFDSADSIVAIGQYEHGQFAANKLLIKCPSKYQAGQKNN